MADTSYYKTHVEPYVRGELVRLHQRPFSSQILQLPTGGTHEFDAVAEDGSIVASIKSLSGNTASGKRPAGKYASCLTELYFLTLVEAPRRMLVLTTPSLHTMFARYMQGRLHPGLEIELIVVPPEIQAEIDRIKDIASGEVSRFDASIETIARHSTGELLGLQVFGGLSHRVIVRATGRYRMMYCSHRVETDRSASGLAAGVDRAE